MSEQLLHAGERHIDAPLVQALLREQCPQWMHLRLRRLDCSGTDNVIYRLGEELLIRLPRTEEAALRMSKEHKWLPMIGDRLPLRIPVPLFMGKASGRFPAPWSVSPWFSGQTADMSAVDEVKTAGQLAELLAAMRRLPIGDDLLPGPHNFFRGVALSERDGEVQAALAQLAPLMDVSAASQAWQALRDATPWRHSPVLIHGDLLPANILTSAGQITAVLDFGGMGAGDPACDLIPAWSVLSAAGRAHFRQLIEYDRDAWLRGQGWALSIGLVALPYYRRTLPGFAALAERMIDEVMRDLKAS